MSPSRSEVRRLAQDDPHLLADATYGRLVMRRLSPPVTWAIVRWTPLSADAVTWLSIACGVVGGGLVAVGSAPSAVAAALLLQLAYLLDTVDGEVARARRTAGRRGTYLDLIGHFLQNRALYAGAGYLLMVVTEFAPWSIAVTLAGVGMASAFGQQAHLAVAGRPAELEPVHGSVAVGARPAGEGPGANAYWLYRRIAFLWSYPASMNLFTLALLVDGVRLGADSSLAPLAVPVLAAVFLPTLAAKQLLNALRLLRSPAWRQA